MSRPGTSLVVSIVSVWELLIKHQAGKLRLHSALSGMLNEILYRSPWTILPIVSEHLPVLAALPALHKDPFDRMLVAQAQHEGMTIVTADEQIAKYQVRTIW
jgi:PIN domain nuclease of toxin-antitoxin system